jgi:putative PEP-CTERM system TPR-repeat lipoprotein
MSRNKLTASILIAILGLSACSEQKTSEQYITSSQQLIENNKIGEAVVELKNAVVNDPSNAKIRYLLGSAYIEEGNYIAAEKELEKAISFGFLDSIIPKLSFVKVKLSKNQEVYALLEDGTNLSDNEYLLLLTYAGVAAIQDGELDRSQDFFNQAVSLNEEATYGKIARAYLHQTNSEYKEALKIVEQVLEQSPSVNEALLLKGNLLYGLEEYELSAAIFSDYVSRSPKAVYVKYFQINSLIKAKKFEEAERLVDWMLDKLEVAPLAHQYKAQLEYQKGNFQEAKLQGDKAAQWGEQFLTGKLIAGLSAYKLQDFEQAYAYLRPLEKYVNDNHPVTRVLAILKLELGYTNEAIVSLNKMNDADTEYLQLASEQLSLKGDVPSALSILDRAEELSPNNAIIKAKKGMLMLREGDLNGIKSLEDALELDQSLVDAETTLALEYLKNDEQEKVNGLISKLVNDETSKIRGLLLQGTQFSKLNSHDRAKKAFESILDIEPDNLAANFNLANYAMAERQFEKSIALYRKVLLRSPNHQEAIRGFLSASVNNKKLADGIEFLENLAQGNTYTTLGLATAYRLAGKHEKVIQLLSSRIESNNDVIAMHSLMVGDSYLALGELDKAKEIYKKGLSTFGNNYVLILREIGIDELQKNYSEAAKKINNALTIFPDSTPLKLLQANIAFLKGDRIEAKKYVDTLNDKHIKNPLLSSLNGHFAYEDGLFDKASEYYYEAYQIKPDRLNTLSLARTLNVQNRHGEAAELIENYLSVNQDTMMEFLLAELYVRSDKVKAVVYYKKLANQYPTNTALLNNLAWQLYLAEQYNEAFKYASKAIELNPNDQNILDTYDKIKGKM